MNIRQRRISAAASIAMILALAVGWPSPGRAAESDLKLIRATLSRSLSAPFLWGFNAVGEKYGLRVQVLDALTNADQQRNIQTGGVQVGSVGYQSAAVMAEQNVDNVKIIAGMYVGGQNLIMRKGVELKSWKDIEGKKIGRPSGTYAGVLFTLAAEINGVDLSKVNIVNTTPAGTPELQALKGGDLDGFVLWSPILDRAVIDGYGYYPACCDIGATGEFGAGNQLLAANTDFLKDRKLAVTFLKGGDLDGFVLWSPILDRAVIDGYGYYPACCDIGATREFGAGNQLLAANTDFLKDRKLAVTFLKAYVESMDFYARNPEKTLALVAQYTGGSPAILHEAMNHSQWTYRVSIGNAVNVAREGPKFGFTKTDVSDKVAGYFDLGYLAEATGQSVEQLGSYGR